MEFKVVPHHGELIANRLCKLLKHLHLSALHFLQFLFEFGIGIRMLVFETEVLKFTLDGEETESMCQWGINILRLACNFILLLKRLRLQGTHVMKPIGNFDEHHPHVF